MEQSGNLDCHAVFQTDFWMDGSYKVALIKTMRKKSDGYTNIDKNRVALLSSLYPSVSGITIPSLK